MEIGFFTFIKIINCFLTVYLFMPFIYMNNDPLNDNQRKMKALAFVQLCNRNRHRLKVLEQQWTLNKGKKKYGKK